MSYESEFWFKIAQFLNHVFLVQLLLILASGCGALKGDGGRASSLRFPECPQNFVPLFH